MSGFKFLSLKVGGEPHYEDPGLLYAGSNTKNGSIKKDLCCYDLDRSESW
jgi:hypothetical protein